MKDFLTASANQRLVSASSGARRFPRWVDYLRGGGLVGLAAMASITFHWLKPANQVMFYLAAIIIAGLFLGRGPTLVVTLLSVLLFDFLQVDPRLTLTVAHPEDLLTFLGLGLVGVIISNSAVRLREQVATLRVREAHLAALNSLSHDLTATLNLQETLDSVVWHIGEIFSRKAVVLLYEKESLQVAASSPELELGGYEWQAAKVAYNAIIAAGSGTQEENQSILYFIPLETFHGPEGVLGIGPRLDGQILTTQEKRLLAGFANLAALAIERSRLEDQAREAKILENTERLQSALLNSISHELRTPLASITGALSSLSEDTSQPVMKDAAKLELVETAYGEAQRLNLLVGNLLDMTRLEGGVFRLSLSPCDIQDLIGVCLSRFGVQSKEHSIEVSLPDILPMLRLDERLMAQVLMNLLDNAVKYSPEKAPIQILVNHTAEDLIVRVADSGVGIPETDLEKIFTRFYRSARAHTYQGIGLGLSISKEIVEAHGGRIWAENRDPKGAVISFSIPLTAGRMFTELGIYG